MSLIATGQLANHKHSADLELLRSLAGAAGSLPIRELVERFVSYNGFLFPEFAGVIIEAIREACRRSALVDPATAVGRLGRVNDDLLARLGLGHVTYLAEGPVEPEATCRLLGTCANAHQSEELPQQISRRLRFENCPALDFHAATGATLFVGPCTFQLFDTAHGHYIRGATARPHTTNILPSPMVTVERPVVLIQDVFNGYNFAHFLLDWITRLAVFALRGPVRAAECFFVFGGVPVEFHRIVLDAARTVLNLDDENFFFPTTNVLIRSTAYIGYFSDQCAVAHPAQMCRPEAMAWMDRLAHTVVSGTDAGPEKLYISRGDAGRRAVANEAELYDTLGARGFEFVRLGDLPVADQLSVMRSANSIVAAHGMGLTYLALHTRSDVKLVELHNPLGGTDTYAFVCKAKGFEYTPVLGESIEGTSDFHVDPGQVARVLDRTGSPVVSNAAPQILRMDTLGPDWHPGCQSSPAVATTDIAPPLPDGAVLKHLRDAASRVYDTNVGWWQLAMLQPLKVYTFSCSVYIPASFHGERVSLTLSGPQERTVEADLSRRDAWQLLSMIHTLPRAVAEWNLVLRVSSDVETVLYSSVWRVDQAPFARSDANGFGPG